MLWAKKNNVCINIHSPDFVIFLVDKSKCWKGSTHHKTKQNTNPRENRIGVVPIVILMSDFVNEELFPLTKHASEVFDTLSIFVPGSFSELPNLKTTKRKKTNLLPSTIIVGDMFFCLCLDLEIKSSNDVDHNSKTKTLFQTSTHMHHTC